MKKIFYSMMAVALCACSQSDVDDMPTPPQPENKGITFTVVDNGFVDEDGTRVIYGEYGSANNGAYKATFEEGDEIGVFAIKSDGITVAYDNGKTPDDNPDTYTVENVKLTLTGGVWKSETPIVLNGADLLFAYAPYRADAKHKTDKPLFTGAKGSWAVSTGNNRFFAWPYNTNFDDSGDNFELNDWMGAATNVTAGQTNITFEMIHMREMIELTTPKSVELKDLTLAYGGDDGSKNKFTPYHIESTNKHVYRILTTEWRGKNTVYATIKDGNIEKKYKKTLSGYGAGKCFCVNINYIPEGPIEVSTAKTLAAALTERYDSNYASDARLTTLVLTGELATEDWNTLRSLQHLTSLDMSALTNNTSIPAGWLKDAPLKAVLGNLTLPSKLESIGDDALLFPGDRVITIELPASVKTIGARAFMNSNKMQVHIPEGSLLNEIGAEAFSGLITVYNDPSNISTLVIPASVTSISNHAFNNMSGLRYVTFQTTEAPATANLFGNTAIESIYVPHSANYKNKGLFTGKRVIAGKIPLTTENYVSDYTLNSDGQGLSALCDNSIETFWHTIYAESGLTPMGDQTYGQFIDITLPDGVTMNAMAIQYGTRKQNNNAVPTKINVYTSTDGTWGDPLFTLPKDGNTLPTGAGVTYTSEQYTAAAPFTKIRFAITESKLGSLTAAASSKSTSLSELTIYEDAWIDTDPTPAQ